MRSFFLLLLSLMADQVACQKHFNQTAYRTAQTTITCEYPKHDNHLVKYFCKENGTVCEDILSTDSPLQSNETFTLIKTNNGFRVSIRNVSLQHRGVYWCGLKSEKDAHQAGRRKINLEVTDIRNFTKSPAVGQTLKYWCQYLKSGPIFICKGEDPSVCQPFISRNKKNNGTFSMEDKEKEKKIYITVDRVKAEDAGTYWCGANSTDKTHSDIFYHKFTMIVAPSLPAPASTESPGETAGGIWFVITMVICAVVLLLLLFIFLAILIRKRFSKNTTPAPAAAAAQHVREDYVYEEIQEHHQNQGYGNAMKSVYATVNFSRNPSASLHYSTINFNQSSDKAAGDRLFLKPSFSSCEYSCVKQSPANTFANQPSRPAEDPLYSRVNKPQKQ
ncbi:polymeric immunoglobulin receptor-like [Xyrichtys novacula]|nr:polymeric immunoglobulin receptor-like [Xyrichtys novacula]